MHAVEIVALLALLQYICFGVMVGRARARTGLQVPAVTGPEEFERAYRVQANTLELLIALLPGLFIAARFWPALWVAALGVVYLIGRFIYAWAYTHPPASRALGFALSMGPVLALLLMGLAGALFR